MFADQIYYLYDIYYSYSDRRDYRRGEFASNGVRMDYIYHI